MSKENLQKQSSKKVSFLKLFKLASRKDIYFIIFGSITAVLNGVMQPLFGQLFGEMTQILSPESTKDEIFDGCAKIAGYFILVGTISFFLSCCMLYFWINAGEKQALNIRMAYYQSLVSQEVGYFDQINSNELSSKVASDCFKIQQAIGEKLCLNLYSLSMFLGSLIISFIRGWQIALVSCIVIPIVWYSCKFITWVSNGVSQKTTEAYKEAGGIAEQALNSMRTVKSLNGEEFEKNKYTNLVTKAFLISKKYSIFIGVALGLIFILIYNQLNLSCHKTQIL